MGEFLDLSIVIPVHNEEASLHSLFRELQETCGAMAAPHGSGVKTEIIFVDDGSIDSTPIQLSRLSGARVLHHNRRMGYGAALQTGFAVSRGKWVAMLDGDHTYPPGMIPTLIGEALQSGADLVIAARYGDGHYRTSPVRRVGNTIFRTCIQTLTGRRVCDPTSGMRVFRRGLLRSIGPLPTGFELGLAMTIRALTRGMSVREVPVSPRPRMGHSKVFLPTAGPHFLMTLLRECLAEKRWDSTPKPISADSMTPMA